MSEVSEVSEVSKVSEVSEVSGSVGSVGSPPKEVASKELHLDNSRTFMAMSISRV